MAVSVDQVLLFAGDFRVRGLDFGGLQECDLLYVGDPEAPQDIPLTRRDSVVFGHGPTLTLWTRVRAQWPVPVWKRPAPQEPSVFESLFVPRGVRARLWCAAVGIPAVDALCPVGEFVGLDDIRV
jgi:hypothetical protein